jgi:hypothetical protein
MRAMKRPVETRQEHSHVSLVTRTSKVVMCSTQKGNLQSHRVESRARLHEDAALVVAVACRCVSPPLVAASLVLAGRPGLVPSSRAAARSGEVNPRARAHTRPSDQRASTGRTRDEQAEDK